MVLRTAEKKAIGLKIIISAVVCLFLLILLFPVRLSVSEKIYQLKMQAVEIIESRISHKITYSSIAPSILHAFEIRDFTVMSSENPSEALIRIEKLRLDFNPAKFRFDNPVNALSGLLIVNSQIDFNSAKNPEISSVLKNLTKSPASDTSDIKPNQAGSKIHMPDNFTVRGRNIGIRVENDNLNADLSRLFFSLSVSEEGDLQLAMKTGASMHMTGLPEIFPGNRLMFNSDLKISGRIDSDFKWVNLDIDTKNLASNIISAGKLAWNVAYNSPSTLRITKTGDNIPLDLSLNADFNTKIYTVGINAQDFVFNNYFTPEEMLSSYSLFGTASLSGKAQLTYSNNENGIDYSGILSIAELPGILDTPIDLSADFSGHNRQILVTKSSVNAAPGRAGFSGRISLEPGLPAVSGRLDIPGLVFRGYSVKSSINISTGKDKSYTLDASETTLNELVLNNTEIVLKPYDDNIEFSINSDLNTGPLSEDHIYSEGVLQFGEEYYIQALLNADNLLVTPVIEAVSPEFRVPDVFRNFELSTEIYLSGSLSQLSFASSGIRLYDRFNPGRQLSLAVSGNNSGLRISNMNLNWDDYNLKGNVDSILSDDTSMYLKTDLDFNGIELKTSGVVSENGSLSLFGDYGFKLNFFTAPDDVRTFALRTERLPLHSAEPSFLTINAAGFFRNTDNWKLLLNDLTLDGLATGYGSGTLSLAALFSQDGGNFYRLNYRDEKTSLSGGCSIALTDLLPFPEGKVQLNLSSAAGNEKYSLTGSFGAAGYDGKIDFSGFPLRRIKNDFPVKGEIKGAIELAGTLSDPQFRLTLATQKAEMNNERVSLSATASYKDLDLLIEQAAVTFGNYKTEDLSGNLDLATGKHNIGGRILSDSSFFGFQSDFKIDAETVTAASIFDLPELAGGNFQADLAMSDIFVNGVFRYPWHFKLSRKEQLMSIIGGASNEIVCNYYGDGSFTAEASEPFPVKLSAAGILSDGNINATVSEIKYIFDNLDIAGFSFYEGDLSGKIRIQGPVNDPDLFGQLDFHKMVLSPPIVLDVSEPFDTSFFVSGKDITAPVTKITTNNGIAMVGASAVIERWLPRNYDIKISVPKGNAISARFYRKPFYIQGFCDGSMNIYGDFSNMYIDGDLNGSKAVFMINSDLNYGSPGKPKFAITCDLNIVTGENNQFFWPNQDYPILKAFLSPENNLNLKYNVDSGLFLAGDLVLKGGEIFYFERNFYIKEGSIKFNNETIQSMDPLLSTRAEIRDVNTEGELTKIFLVVDQSPLSSFIPRFESEPAMSTAEIISMLGGNIFSTFERGDTGLGSAAMLTADLLAQFTLLRSIEDGLKTWIGLDLLSIRSSFFSNLLENTVFGGSNDNSQGNLARYLDNTTLFLGKYFTDDIFLQGMIQFDLYNDSGYSGSPEMNIDSEITLEWEGPVANVEFSFYPDFNDPLSGLNQTSLGLSWHFSY